MKFLTPILLLIFFWIAVLWLLNWQAAISIVFLFLSIFLIALSVRIVQPNTVRTVEFLSKNKISYTPSKYENIIEF